MYERLKIINYKEESSYFCFLWKHFQFLLSVILFITWQIIGTEFSTFTPLTLVLCHISQLLQLTVLICLASIKKIRGTNWGRSQFLHTWTPSQPDRHITSSNLVQDAQKEHKKVDNGLAYAVRVQSPEGDVGRLPQSAGNCLYSMHDHIPHQ